MQRTYQKFTLHNTAFFKLQLLYWAAGYATACYLDSQQYKPAFGRYDCLVAAGAFKVFEAGDDFLTSLSTFDKANKDWIFGHFNYDIKNYLEALTSNNIDTAKFPEHHFFVPEVVIQINNQQCTIGTLTTPAAEVFQAITATALPALQSWAVKFTPRMQREAYLQKVEALKQHLHHGDCYEINFCQEFYAHATIDGTMVYQQLMQKFSNPFSCFYQLNQHQVLCASPERYVCSFDRQIVSQPIKGTAPRSSNPAVDKSNLIKLLNSHKDRSENVIVVDLVRNDLSKVCNEGSVKVQELCGAYSFPHVHQLISTVIGNLNNDVDFATVLKATFPMGSMTGAPKKRVMELIEQYEITKRGIYSGTIGYIDPNKNFDFNVVIRSFVYNSATGYISYHAGSGITSLSNAANEYDECITKAAAISGVFSG